MNRKKLFDSLWHSNWFTETGYMVDGTIAYSSNDIQSLHVLAFMAIGGMEEFLTIPEKELKQCCRKNN